MKHISLRSVLLLAAFTIALPLSVSAQQDATAPDSTTVAKPPTDAELRTQFTAADALRALAKEGTKERADAAQKALEAAAGIAWNASNAGNFEETATWFARRAALKKEVSENMRAAIKAAAVASNQNVAEKKQWQDIGASFDDIYRNQLYIYAQENQDTPTLLALAREILTVRRADLVQLQKIARLQTKSTPSAPLSPKRWNLFYRKTTRNCCKPTRFWAKARH